MRKSLTHNSDFKNCMVFYTKDLLQKVVPSPVDEKRVLDIFNSVSKKLLKELKGKAVPFMGGSGGKGTSISGSHDIDIYVMFDYAKYKNLSDKISQELYSALKKCFSNVDVLHGSRDYYQIEQDNFKIELIPILEIKKAEQARNITDVSILHVKWVKKFSNPKLRNEIRLFKQFCKANRVYGAESYIGGFSGYICEILTIYYGGIENLFNAIAKWDNHVLIDFSKFYNSREEALSTLNISKLNSPIIIIDPVDSSRNASAALTQDKFQKLINRVKLFIASPSDKFFDYQDLLKESKDSLISSQQIVVVSAFPKAGKTDIVGAKLRNAYEHVLASLKNHSFEVISSDMFWDTKGSALFWFVLPSLPLSKEYVHNGPNVSNIDGLIGFKRKWGDKVNIRGNQAYVIVKRDFVNVSEFLNNLLSKDEVILSNVKKICVKEIIVK